MKYLLAYILALIVLLLFSPGWASDRLLTWDGQPGAASYEIQQSVDYGKTWTVLSTPAASVCTGTPLKCSLIQSLPVSGVIMLRFGARNANGLTVRFDDGAWHCESCAPPGTITNSGIQ